MNKRTHVRSPEGNGFGSALSCDATIDDPAGEAEATISLNIKPDQPAGDESC